jgi:hypothetical protein
MGGGSAGARAPDRVVALPVPQPDPHIGWRPRGRTDDAFVVDVGMS